MLQNNVVTAYSVTYLFGLICIVLFTSQIAPLMLKINLREEAAKLFARMGGSALSDGQILGAPLLVGRTYRVEKGRDKTVGEIESAHSYGITIQRLKRGDRIMEPSVDEKLLPGDEVLVVGRREAVVRASEELGQETAPIAELNAVQSSLDVLVTQRKADGVSIKDLRSKADPEVGRGVYIAAVRRMENSIPAVPATEIQRGDVLTLFGLRSAVMRASRKLGYVVTPTIKTDFVYLGVGILVGILLGHINFRLAGVPVSFGTGGGCLVSGLIFGWVRARYPIVGSLPSAASQILKDFGLATFIATVGLSSGPDAVRLIRTYGALLPLAGVAVSFVPALISLYVGRRFLKLETPVLLGAIAGQQVSTPALSSLVTAAGNSTPVIGYTITYAISNVLLPLLGPLLVGIAALITQR
jgi:aspartate-alanine antiporter